MCDSSWVTQCTALYGCRAAEQHSLDMATQNYFSHTGSDGSGLEDRAANNGFYTFPLGENIAAGYISIQSVVLAWMWYVFGLPPVLRQRPACRHHTIDMHVAW